MTLIEQFKSVLDGLAEKKFYTYLLAAFGVIFVLIVLFIGYYFYARSGWYAELEELNTQRTMKVKRILTEKMQLQNRQREINKMLEDDPIFKIAGYCDEVLVKLKLVKNGIKMGPLIIVDLPNSQYTEESLGFSLSGINMMQLVKLLEELEEKKRIYLKKLEITKSEVKPQAIDVDITMATLTLK